MLTRHDEIYNVPGMFRDRTPQNGLRIHNYVAMIWSTTTVTGSSLSSCNF